MTNSEPTLLTPSLTDDIRKLDATKVPLDDLTGRGPKISQLKVSHNRILHAVGTTHPGVRFRCPWTLLAVSAGTV
jgi:hypothetical protein